MRSDQCHTEAGHQKQDTDGPDLYNACVFQTSNTFQSDFGQLGAQKWKY